MYVALDLLLQFGTKKSYISLRHFTIEKLKHF